jgi:hypothetical protein
MKKFIVLLCGTNETPLAYDKGYFKHKPILIFGLWDLISHNSIEVAIGVTRRWLGQIRKWMRSQVLRDRTVCTGSSSSFQQYCTTKEENHESFILSKKHQL